MTKTTNKNKEQNSDTPPKTNITIETKPFKMYPLFKMLIFHCNVGFQGVSIDMSTKPQSHIPSTMFRAFLSTSPRRVPDLPPIRRREDEQTLLDTQVGLNGITCATAKTHCPWLSFLKA